MRPTTLSVAVVLAGTLIFSITTARAADETAAPLPPPPEATDTPPTPATPGKSTPKTGATTKADVATGDLPTMQQIQALYDAANYNDLLKALAKVLPIKGKAAESYDRQKLLQLKLETHMKLKQQAPA